MKDYKKIIKELEKEYINSSVPDLAPGDSVDVHTKIVEGGMNKWLGAAADTLARLDDARNELAGLGDLLCDRAAALADVVGEQRALGVEERVQLAGAAGEAP